MTPTIATRSQSLSGRQKAAIFLMGVGDEISAQVLRHLAPDEVRGISAEIATTEGVGSETMLSVFHEFHNLLDEGRLYAKGGTDCARRLLEQAFGSESASQFLAPTHEPSQEAAARQSIFEHAEPQQLAAFLKKENPQTIALVLANAGLIAQG